MTFRQLLIMIATVIGILLALVWHMFARIERGDVAILMRITDLAEANEAKVTFEHIDIWGEHTGWRSPTMRESAVYASWMSEYTRIATGRMRAGRYERLRLDGVQMEIQSSEHGTTMLVSLSPTLLVDVPIIVENGKMSVVLIDVSYDRSRYKSDTERMIFAPTVRVESRSNVILSQNNAEIRVLGGTVHANNTYGMTAHGAMRAHFRLPNDTRFSFEHNELFVVPHESLLSPVERIMQDMQSNPTEVQEAKNDVATMTPVNVQ